MSSCLCMELKIAMILKPSQTIHRPRALSRICQNFQEFSMFVCVCVFSFFTSNKTTKKITKKISELKL